MRASSLRPTPIMPLILHGRLDEGSVSFISYITPFKKQNITYRLLCKDVLGLHDFQIALLEVFILKMCYNCCNIIHLVLSDIGEEKNDVLDEFEKKGK